jgi:hypothetical protein
LAVNLSMQSRQGFDKADFQLAMLRPWEASGARRGIIENSCFLL